MEWNLKVGMWGLCSATSGYPPILKASIPMATLRSSSPPFSVPINHRYHRIHSPFVSEVKIYLSLSLSHT